jgi:FkbM family methyltransferase
MIETNGIIVHIDPRGDRIEGSAFEIDGWIAAKGSVNAVWLPASSSSPLPSCKRPDVVRVFPGRNAFGFSGKCSDRDIGPNGLRLAFQIGASRFEVQHPLPSALPVPSKIERLITQWRLKLLARREGMATNAHARWNFALRRHLLLRKQRANIFRRMHADALLSDFSKALPDAVFLQIGANDGLTGDPLHHLITCPTVNWRGVMVEPVVHLFAQVSQRYANNSAIQLEQAAIGEADGTADIYRLNTVSEDSLWLDQVPSLDRETLHRTAAQLGASADRIIAEKVPCLRVDTLLQGHGIKRLDLLVIDTEGWDWKILRQFDLNLLRPKLILYEHQHLSEEDRKSAQQFLRLYDYDLTEMPEGDTIAWTLSNKPRDITGSAS